MTIQLATDYNYYRPEIRAIQNQPEITVHFIGQISGLQYSTNPNITRVFRSYKQFTLTDLAEINNRFNQARNNATKYDYGVFLLQQEVWHPSLQVSWSQKKLTDWAIEGTLTLPNGAILELLKPWYIRTKGAWNQSWWDTIKATNNPWESTVKAWSAYYGYTLLKAWHEHMRSLGKKSAMLGLCGFRETPENFRNLVKNNYYPGEMFNYFIQNYDLQTTGIHPTTMAKIPDDILWAKVLRTEWGYKGKIVHILSSCWSDGWGCPWNEMVAKEDFRQVAPYVDIVLAHPFADTSEWKVPATDIPKHIQYIPIVIQWMKEYIPCNPSICDFTITQ